MLKYRVPPELAPGVYRAGERFYRVGDVFKVKEGGAAGLHPYLIPLDEASRKALLETQAALPDHDDGKGKKLPHALKAAKVPDVEVQAEVEDKEPTKREQVAKEGGSVKDEKGAKPKPGGTRESDK